jgi:hypothetical protein
MGGRLGIRRGSTRQGRSGMGAWRTQAALDFVTLREPPAPDCDEATFQAKVEKLLKAYGWTYTHIRMPKRDNPGHPDLVALRGTAQAAECFYAELKTATGRASLHQRHWLLMLAVAGQRVYLWRPADWQAILAVIATPQPAGCLVPPPITQAEKEVARYELIATGGTGRPSSTQKAPRITKPTAVPTQWVT